MGTDGTGLVLEGGGFRGIYTAAVLDVFLTGKVILSLCYRGICRGSLRCFLCFAAI